ncbi:DNA repair protein RadC [Polaribacter sp.]|nr:DNA repair protein RadC [Polaribacter sp.]MDA9093214.1 DNA repair protein RadC [Polaribacter sp.]MDB4181733.1 DNA repair protein RadC [Polaribacter sp.]
MKKLTIKGWALDDRPRKKLVLMGKKSLSDAELIAILIGSGSRNESAVSLSKKILNSVNNNINELAKLSVEELTRFHGVGAAKAIAIITALELGKRRQLETALELPEISTSKGVFHLMQPIIGDLQHEEFWAIFFNNSNKVIAKHRLSKGGLTVTVVDVRLLYMKALATECVGVIVCHNHPSGKLTPSKADKEVTLKIKEAGSTLDIKLLDHLIITEKSYFSFADDGIL